MEIPWVIFKLKDELFAISSENVTSIVKDIKITSMPNALPHVKGIVNHRDEIFKVYDLRKILGFTSLEDEHDAFCQLMDQRAQDHKNWINELELSTLEEREFKLTTDPHKCAFGKWYDQYKSESYYVNDLLEKFDEPHKRIHKLGLEVLKLIENGKVEDAKEKIVSSKKTDLVLMLNLFEEVKRRHIKSSNEIAIIMRKENQKCSILVDSVLSVESIEDVAVKNEENQFLNIETNPIFDKLGKLSGDQLVLKLSDVSLLSGNIS